eukprot:scaffold5957_cov32-Tisochrysis_lutea.AAC.4
MDLFQQPPHPPTLSPAARALYRGARRENVRSPGRAEAQPTRMTKSWDCIVRARSRGPNGLSAACTSRRGVLFGVEFARPQSDALSTCAAVATTL